jgi:hypothetical protein
MIRNIIKDTLAVVGIFAICFSVLFTGYGFTTEDGLGFMLPNVGGYYWEVSQ